MKIELDQGQPVIDAQDLGDLLEMDPGDVQANMRAGEITGKYETGDGENAGRFRLTFFHSSGRVRPTCAADGEVISTIRLKQGVP